MLSQQGLGRTSKRAKRENSERWLLTYADLITLLLAFFVVMYAISSADARKFARFAGAMRKAFNVGILEANPAISIMDPSLEVTAATIGQDEQTLTMETRDMETIMDEMGWVSQQEGLADKVSISIRPEGIAISLSGNLLFSSGRAELRPDAVQLLHSIGRALSRLPNSVRIEGHTDDVPPSGTEFVSNWELSGARSIAVTRYLAEVENINPERLSAAAFSQYQPLAPNDSAKARAKNRRSEILILYPAGGSARPTPSAAGVTISPEGENHSVAATR